MAKKEVSYRDAVAEIESILTQIENEELDVDEMSVKVKRAAELIKLCREKLYKTEKEVEAIFNEMEEKKPTE
jgi:exodeoxyribonuclease VII small subunit